MLLFLSLDMSHACRFALLAALWCTSVFATQSGCYHTWCQVKNALVGLMHFTQFWLRVIQIFALFQARLSAEGGSMRCHLGLSCAY